MEVLRDLPTESSFTPLSVHQAQTPDSFFSGPPILYHYSPSATLILPKHDHISAPALSSLAEGGQRPSNGAPTTVNGDAEEEEGDEEIEVRGVDSWVTSERLILYSPTLSTGISIPYPTISLHALRSQPPSLFLQVLTSAQTFDDHDPDSTVSITIIPSTALTPTNGTYQATTADETAGTTQPEQQQSPAQVLYTALTSCANLHPDPLSGSDDDQSPQNPAIRFEGDNNGREIDGIYPLTNGHTGGASALPPPMPGSGGWITAENVSEFFDEDGNWRGGEEWTESEVMGVPGAALGDGAGRVRERDVDEDGVEEEDETKWRRTE